MHDKLIPGLVGVAIALAYVAFVGLIVYLVVRWRRRQMAERAARLAQELQERGARHVGSGLPGGFFRGTEQEFDLGGNRVFTNVYSVNRYYYRVNLRVDAGALPWITLYPEGAAQRFGKAIGLNREVQTGDQPFDDAAYVDTIEEDEPVRRVLSDAAVREGALDLLRRGYKVSFSEKGLEAFRLYPHGTDPDLAGFDEVAATLARMRAALPHLEREAFRGKISFLTGKVLVVLLGWIPFILAGGALEAIMDSPGSRTLDAGGKGTIVLLAAVTAWLLYVAALVIRLRGRSYALPVVGVMSFFGLLGIPLCGVIGVLSLNQALDKSAGEERVATVLRTSKYKGDCRVRVGSWMTPGAEESFTIKCALRDAFPKGAALHLREHPGALGMPWIEPIREAQ